MSAPGMCAGREDRGADRFTSAELAGEVRDYAIQFVTATFDRFISPDRGSGKLVLDEFGGCEEPFDFLVALGRWIVERCGAVNLHCPETVAPCDCMECLFYQWREQIHERADDGTRKVLDQIAERRRSLYGDRLDWIPAGHFRGFGRDWDIAAAMSAGEATAP